MSKCHRVQEEDNETLKAMYSNIYRTKSDAQKNRPQKQYDFYRKKVEVNLALDVKVFTFGNPSILQHTVTSGTVSGYREATNNKFIQTDAPINPGNSGSPMIDTILVSHSACYYYCLSY